MLHVSHRADSVPASAACDSILVVGHGTQSAEGQAAFHRLVEKVAALRPCAMVEGCFLEMAEPRIAEAMSRLYERGGRRMVVAPLLLFAAAHAKDDIPSAIRQAAERLEGLEFRQSEPLACHARIVGLALARFEASLSEPPRRAPRDTAWLMVGRGSHDADATNEMRRLAGLCVERSGAGWLEVGFTDMAEPSVATALDRAAESNLPCIVVQPHLLFHGFLIERLSAQIDESRRRFRDKEWRLAEPLGPDDGVALALLDRIDASLAA